MIDANDAFERQVADVASRAVGPERHVDALAVARQAMAQPPNRGFVRWVRPFAAVTAGLGLLFVGAMLVTNEVEQPAVSPSPLPTVEPIPSFTTSSSVPIGDDRRHFRSAARLATGEIAVAGFSRRDDGSVSLPATWTSIDGGATWTESSLLRGTSGEATDVIATEDGFVAVVRSDTRASSRESVVWSSTDGLEWQERAVLPETLLTSVLAVPEGLAAVGVEFREADGHEEPAAYPTLWLSGDGDAWEAHQISPPWHAPGEDVLLAGAEEGHLVDLPLDLVRSDAGRWMVSGIDRDLPGGADPITAVEHPAVWIGAPGEPWVQASPPTERAARLDVVGWRPSGFVVKGEVRDADGVVRHGIWVTPDGTTWEQALDLGPGAPLEVAAADDDLMAIVRPPVAWKLGGALYPALSNVYRDTGDDHPWADRPDRLLERAPVVMSRDGRTWSSAEAIEGFPVAATFGRDGSFVVVGADVSGCDSWWCAYESNFGAVPTVWIGEAR